MVTERILCPLCLSLVEMTAGNVEGVGRVWLISEHAEATTGESCAGTGCGYDSAEGTGADQPRFAGEAGRSKPA